jgi:hypothetical protein
MNRIHIQPVFEVFGKIASYRLRVYDHEIDRNADLSTLPDFIGIGYIDIVRGVVFAEGFLFKSGFRKNLLEVYKIMKELGGKEVIFESHIKNEVIERYHDIDEMIKRLSR